ncbi:MAG TPA: ISAzo13 family transposase [Ktedonobacteraceae bacterium]|nr:ISAzo13 family transposase [Ktedonobacteraceae bacterium]
MKEEEEAIKRKFELLAGELNERTRRLIAAAEAMALGWGGISAVARATGVSQRAIRQGIKELKAERVPSQGRIRRAGGGRKKTVSKDESLCEDLERLVEPVTRGDPESPLRWTCKSVRKLAAELGKLGHQVSYQLVSELLHELGYSLQANRKTREGGDHPDRDAQFAHLNAQAEAYLSAGEPVVSVDAKKKELVGDFKNSGREWHPQGEPEEVRVYDFPIAGLGRATPYGVYDLAHNAGWVNVGIDHNTAAFAVESLRRWWNEVGRSQYPKAKRLLISADGGGSNGSRVRLWKWELQQLADETGLAISVCHLPPGTSKWNKIEHRLFAWISQNWRGKPLTSYAVILKLIAATTTQAGLTVQCQLDTNTYPAGRKVSDEDMASICLVPDAFHGEWNYTILPHDYFN